VNGASASGRSPSDAEIGQRLRHVETMHDLFAPTIDGWSAWQLLRFPVATELARAAPQSPSTGRPWSRSELIRMGVDDWARYVRLPRARILAKTFVSALAEVQEGRYRDVFFDDILEVVGSHVKIEVQNARGRVEGARAAHLPPSAATVGIDLGARALSRLKTSREVADVADVLGDVISTELGIAGFDRDVVERRLLSFRWSKRLYGRLLDRVQPRFALVADTSEFELFAAAKERGIRCVELQHGIFSRNHPDALGASAVAHRGRLIVPDALLLFGPYWEDELRSGGFYRDELRVAGSPRIDRFRSRRQSAPRRDGAYRVLVTSQGVATEELARFLAETMSLARAGGFDCLLDLKLHPIYDSSSKESYDAALGGASDVRILASEERPSTLELLSEADAHVSISSACHFESLGIGVPTIVLSLPGYEAVLPLVAAGHASLVETPAELLRLLRDVRGVPIPEEVSARYYRPGALERIARELGHPSSAGKPPLTPGRTGV
jgi:hypothetical protein